MARASSMRFIPTGVGNMNSCQRIFDADAVHPHGCGEHVWVCGNIINECGSSPRVWGTLPHGYDHIQPARFIPTGVGNISNWWKISAITSVHPHGCGEHNVIGGVIDEMNGSSPRVWGTSAGGQTNLAKMRFIPTGVGNICKSISRDALEAVHPHGCGEH